MLEFPRSTVAYDPEAQALHIANQQQSGELMVLMKHLRRKTAVDELNKTWLRVDSTDLLADHCEVGLFDALEKDDKYIEIRSKLKDRIFTLGNAKFAVAAIILSVGVLYISPHFDLESFKRTNKSFSKLVGWLHR